MKLYLLCIIDFQFLLTIIFLQCATEQKLSQFQFCLMNIDRQLPEDAELNVKEKAAFDRIEKKLNDVTAGFKNEGLPAVIQSLYEIRDIFTTMFVWFYKYNVKTWWNETRRFNDHTEYPKKNALKQRIINGIKGIKQTVEQLTTKKDGKTPIENYMLLHNDVLDLRSMLYKLSDIIDGDSTNFKLLPNSGIGALGLKQDWKILGVENEYDQLNDLLLTLATATFNQTQ